MVEKIPVLVICSFGKSSRDIASDINHISKQRELNIEAVGRSVRPLEFFVGSSIPFEGSPKLSMRDLHRAKIILLPENLKNIRKGQNPGIEIDEKRTLTEGQKAWRELVPKLEGKTIIPYYDEKTSARVQYGELITQILENASNQSRFNWVQRFREKFNKLTSSSK